MLEHAKKDAQQNTPDWQMVRDAIDGACVHEVLHVPRDHGVLTEIYRPEWDPSGLPIGQLHQSRISPGALNAWSCHTRTLDRLFVTQGLLKIVLYDGREESRTFGTLMQLHIGDPRPTFLVLPPGIWHGIKNIGTGEALLLNMPSLAYDYADPDHYRLPADTPEIPFSWGVSGHG